MYVIEHKWVYNGVPKTLTVKPWLVELRKIFGATLTGSWDVESRLEPETSVVSRSGRSHAFTVSRNSVATAVLDFCRRACITRFMWFERILAITYYEV